MEFLAFENGVLRDERYRDCEVVEDPLRIVRKVYRQQPSSSNPAINALQGAVTDGEVGGFNCSPKTVVFRDFTVGETYTVAVTLTNCTNRSKTFRVLPISPKYRESFHIEYTPPPKISAGLSWKIKVIFTPVENVDLETIITFKTEEGLLFASVKALPKRSSISFSPESIDFGAVIFGEKATRFLTLQNDGALPEKVFFSGSLRKWIEIFHRDAQSGCEVPVLSMKPIAHRLTLAPFSTRRLELTFSPHKDVTIDGEIELRYALMDSLCSRKIPVRGTGCALPVFISSSSEINFNWCFYENTYCEKITITNTTKSSVTVVPEILPEMGTSLVFKPEAARVEANSTFDIYGIFTPTRCLGSQLSCVVRMYILGQASPIFVTFKAGLTERGFTVGTTKLDYGMSSPEEEILLPLKVENLSDLPQIVGFIKLPENVKVMPFQTVTLLPKELFEFKVGVRPPTLGQYTQVIRVTNEYGDSCSVQLTGYGCEHTLRFMRSCLNLPACPINDETTCTTLLQNQTRVSQEFSLVSPFDALKVSPSFGIIYPGQCIPIFVIFRPQRIQLPLSTVTEVVLRPNTKSSMKRGKEREVPVVQEKTNISEEENADALFKDWECNSADEKWSRHSTFFVKCIVRRGDGNEFALLQVNCTVIEPTLIARFLSRVIPKEVTMKKDLPKRNTKKNGPSQNAINPVPVVKMSSSGTRLTIDFGEIPLKYQSERTCLLSYKGEDTIDLQMRPFDASSPFRITKPLPLTLSRGVECTLVIRFFPTKYGSYKEKFVVTSSRANDVTFILSGICQPGDLLISRDRDLPEDRLQSLDRFTFDTVQIGQETRQGFFLHNLNSLPVEVNARLVSDEGIEPKWPEAQSFFLNSNHFTIPGNSKTSGAILFSPQVTGTLRSFLHITAGAFDRSFLVEGRSSEKTVFFTFPEHAETFETHSAPRIVPQRGVFPTQGLSPLDPIQFHCVPEETINIAVGCVKLAANVECVVSDWNESYHESGWKLDPRKATVYSGGQVVFKLSYSPRLDTGDVSICKFSFVTRCSQPQGETVCHVRCTGTM